MIPTDRILKRTFRIRCGSQTGTCFTVDVEERRYLVTARHIAGAIDRSADVEIAHEGNWKTLSVQLVGHGDGGSRCVGTGTAISVWRKGSLDACSSHDPSPGRVLFGVSLRHEH